MRKSDIKKFDKLISLKSNEILHTFLELVDGIFAIYDKKTDSFSAFDVQDTECRVIEETTFTDWYNESISSGRVSDNTKNAFKNFYDEMLTCTSAVEGEYQYKINDNGEYSWWLAKAKPFIDQDGDEKVVVVYNLLGQAKIDEDNYYNSEEQLDPGTGILNKRAILEYTTKLLNSHPAYHVTMAIIDVDDFKNVNDEYGHMVGDQVLRDVAAIIKDVVSNNGMVGRIGGDEMFIVSKKLESNDQIREILREIRNRVSILYKGNEDRPSLTVSIGASSYPDDGREYDDLFKIADKMLYLAKEKGKNRYIIYTPELHKDYVTGDVDKISYNNSYLMYKIRKLLMINQIIGNIIQETPESLDILYDKISEAFDIDSIYIYKGEKWKTSTVEVLYENENAKVLRQTCVNNWKACGESFNETDYVNLQFVETFKNDGIKAIDNVNFLEKTAPDARKTLNELGIKQGVDYFLRDEDADEYYIIAFNRNKLMSKISDSDLTYFALLGNIICNYIVKRDKEK